MATVDPWYDYLALPVAPMILLAQGAAVLLVPQRAVRWTLVVGGAVAIAAMLVYVATLPLEGEGANIGAGVLSLWLLVSLGLVVATVRKGSGRRQAARIERISAAVRRATWSKAALSSLVVTLFYPPFALVAVAATALAWWREPSSPSRTVATWLTAIAVPYAGVYVVVELV